jgi:superfamily II DNA/RNA helicase
MSLHNIKLVILDEADKLFENSQFQPNFKKIMTAICGKNNENNKP